jgi:hypothetical protein
MDSLPPHAVNNRVVANSTGVRVVNNDFIECAPLMASARILAAANHGTNQQKLLCLAEKLQSGDSASGCRTTLLSTML